MKKNATGLEKSLKMLGWLSSVCFENGDIPLFNDAAFGISPSPVALFAYAKRLGLNFEKSGLSDSGYRKLVTNKFECLVDVSRVGPDYQPGHAHADTFTFELHIYNHQNNRHQKIKRNHFPIDDYPTNDILIYG